MTYNTVTVTGNNVTGNDGQRVSGSFTPVQPYFDSVNDAEVSPLEVKFSSDGGSGAWSAEIVDPTLDGTGAFWTLIIHDSKQNVLFEEVVQVGHVNGASQSFLSLVAAVPPAQYQTFLPLAGGQVSGPLSELHGNVFALDNFSGATDDVKMSNALAAVVAAGGGTITLGARTHTFTQPWSTSYVNNTTSAFIRITGAGASWNGMWKTTRGVTNCEFTCTGVVACMNFQHLGSIELDHIRFSESSNSGVPLFQTTNATPNLHDNVFYGGGSLFTCVTDAIVLGGTSSSFGAGDTAAYQGYQGFIRNNFFDGIRRAVLWQVFANATDVSFNTVSATCGTNQFNGAAFEFNPPAGNTYGNFLHNNCIEVTGYYYAAKLAANAFSNTLGPNGVYDPGGQIVSAYLIANGATANVVYDGAISVGTVQLVKDLNGNGANQVCSVITQGPGKNLKFTAPALFQSTQPMQVFFNGPGPMGTTASGDMGYWKTVNRLSSSTTKPSIQVAFRPQTMFADGQITNGSSWLFSASAAFTQADKDQVVGAVAGLSSTCHIAFTYTASTMPAWQASTAYALGDMVRPSTANTRIYRCDAAGTSGSSQPSFPTTTGNTVTDGSVTWTCLGTGSAVQLDQNATATNTAFQFSMSRVSATEQLGIIFEGQHVRGGGSAPTVAVNGAAGSGATAAIAGADTSMRVTLSTGTSATAGNLFSITFNQAYSGTPLGVCLTPGNAAAASILAVAGGWFITITASSLSLSTVGVTPSSVASAVFNIMVIQ